MMTMMTMITNKTNASRMLPASRVIYSTLFFVLSMTLVAVLKPDALFTANNTVRPFGVGDGRTMFPLGVVTVVAAVLSMYTFALIDMIYS